MSKGGVVFCFVLSLIGLIFGLPNPKKTITNPVFALPLAPRLTNLCLLLPLIGRTLLRYLNNYKSMLFLRCPLHTPTQPNPFFLYYKLHGFRIQNQWLKILKYKSPKFRSFSFSFAPPRVLCCTCLSPFFTFLIANIDAVDISSFHELLLLNSAGLPFFFSFFVLRSCFMWL